MCTEVINDMKEKKTELITFRTDKITKMYLEEAAKQNKWTTSQVCEEICKQFTINPQPGQIIINTEELKRIYEELKKDELEACKLEITLELMDEATVSKSIEITGLQSGGLGAVMGYEPIYEMTKEEINKIK